MRNFIMIGAGGTGTHLFHPLATYLNARDEEWSLHVIDGDVVEEKNLTRQLFSPAMITMNKAEAITMGCDPMFIKAYPEYLTEDNIARYIQDGDIVLICADNMTVRKRIEDHARTLLNIVVVNGGNEKHSGSVQLYVRNDGNDVTPRIGFLHPEVTAEGPDRAVMTCAQAAALPGGEQTIIANLQSATWMLTALWRYDNDLHLLSEKQAPSPLTWTELQFDALLGTVEHIDQRMSAHWRTA